MKLKEMMIAAALAVAPSVMAQQTYSDIYNALPNMTTDQKYADLSAYCAADPEWANTYLQLAVVCENKMVLTDPLRDAEAALFWAEEALKNYQAFTDIYPKGDARQNPEFYENFNLAVGNKHIEDAAVRAYVDTHVGICTDFKKHSTEAYEALSTAKSRYNTCVGIFASLVAQYPTLDDAIFLADDATIASVRSLKSNMHESDEAFQRYRKMITDRPILNYRQLQEKKPIAQYGVDGLSNSDFYQNRFAVWDYEAFADNFLNQFAQRVLPLRQKMQDVFDAYEAQVEALSDGVRPKPATADNDDYRLLLGKADKGGLAIAIMSYLRARSALVTVECNMTSEASAMITADKMWRRYAEALTALSVAEKQISMPAVRRFASFFWKNFGGVEGIKKYRAKQEVVLNQITQSHVARMAQAFPPPSAQPKEYSVKAAKAPALPMWNIADDERATIVGNYYTSHTALVGKRVAYVAGTKKGAGVFAGAVDALGNTLWVRDMPKAKNVTYVGATDDGMVVGVVQNELPLAIAYDVNGREVQRFNISEGKPVVITNNAMTGGYVGVFENEVSPVSICAYDAQGQKQFDVEMPMMQQADQLVQVDDGFVVIGRDADKVIAAKVSRRGELSIQRVVGKNVARVCCAMVVYSPSIIVVCQDADGKMQCAALNTNCDLGFSTMAQ